MVSTPAPQPGMISFWTAAPHCHCHATIFQGG